MAPKRKPAAADTGVMKRPACGNTDQSIEEVLSCAGSLNERIKLVKDLNLSTQEKVALLNKNFSHKDWQGIHQKVKHAIDKDENFKKDIQEAQAHGGLPAVKMTKAAWILDPAMGDVYQDLCLYKSSFLKKKNKQVPNHKQRKKCKQPLWTLEIMSTL